MLESPKFYWGKKKYKPRVEWKRPGAPDKRRGQGQATILNRVCKPHWEVEMLARLEGSEENKQVYI